MMTSKPLIPQWQTALASLHKLREPLADQSRKELRELVRKRGIIIYTANGGWWYESNSERSTGTFRSERAALVAALDFFNEDNG
jgi:hypothetical protein